MSITIGNGNGSIEIYFSNEGNLSTLKEFFSVNVGKWATATAVRWFDLVGQFKVDG